jgi:WD40 repeat protein
VTTGETVKWAAAQDGPQLWNSELAKATLNADISSISLSSDGTLLAVAFCESLQIHEAIFLERRNILANGSGIFSALQWGPDGCHLATVFSIRRPGSARPSVVRLWDYNQDNTSADTFHQAGVQAAASIASQGAVDAMLFRHSWTSEKAARITPSSKKPSLKQPAHSEVLLTCHNAIDGLVGSFGSFIFSTDSQRVICIVRAQTTGDMAALRCRMEHCSIDVFRRPALIPLFMLHDHKDNAMWVSESPPGSLIASTSWDGTVRLWLATDGRALHTLTSPGHQHQLWAGAFSCDSKLVAAGSGDQTVHVWDTGTGELKHRLGGFTNWIRSLAFHPLQPTTLAAGASGGTLRLFDVPSDTDSKCLQHWQVGSDTNGFAMSFIEVEDVQYSADGQRLLFTSTDGRTMVYDTGTNEKWDFEVDHQQVKEGF